MFLILLSTVLSCDDNEVAWVSVKNCTEYNIDIEFYPTPDANGYRVNESLDPIGKQVVDIYHSPDENIDPCELLSSGYDSIVVTISNPESSVIYFGKQSATNYSIDPFKDSDKWIYEQFVEDFPTNTSLNTTTIHNYILEIDIENILQGSL